uniref:Uncharacterized protein n=1 Tax=Glossina morsitans morsitans TaxID=37546 RepID=A0A1B0FH34_GLOMM
MVEWRNLIWRSRVYLSDRGLRQPIFPQIRDIQMFHLISGENTSKLLHQYPELRGVDRRTTCMLECKRFADRLTAKTGQLATEQAVMRKVRTNRCSLRRMGRKISTSRSTLKDYIWYARELELARAVARLTDQLQKTNRWIVTIDEDFLIFDYMDQVNEHFVLALEGLKKPCAQARKDRDLDEAEEEIDVDEEISLGNIEKNMTVMDTKGETGRDDNTTHTTPYSPHFKRTTLIRQIEQLKAENAALKANPGQKVEAAADSGVPGTVYK